MKVRLYSRALRARYGAESIEDVVEVDEKEIAGPLAAGAAVPVRSDKAEKAVAPEPEKRSGKAKK